MKPFAEYNEVECYFHGCHGVEAQKVQSHALLTGRVELVGRDQIGQQDYGYAPWGHGWIYAMPIHNIDVSWGYACHSSRPASEDSVVFVLGWDGTTNADIIDDGDGYAIPHAAYPVVAVIAQDGTWYSPMEWAKK